MTNVRTFNLANPLSVPTPETYAPSSLREVREIAPDVPYPAVVKPRSKTIIENTGCCHQTLIDDAHYVDSPTELINTYQAILDRYPVLKRFLPLVQECIEGNTTDTVVLADDGEIVTYFQNERVRTDPPSGGVASLLTGVHEPQMCEFTTEIIDALKWTGPAMVEFMHTPDDEFYLIEVNGRYWGSLPFTIASGIDIPWLHYQQLCGNPVSPPLTYRTGLLQQRLLYPDLKWLLEHLRTGQLGVLPEFLRTTIAARQTFISYDDPLPSLYTLCQLVELTGRALVNSLIQPKSV